MTSTGRYTSEDKHYNVKKVKMYSLLYAIKIVCTTH